MKKKKSSYIRERLAQEKTGALSRKAKKYCFNRSKKIRTGDIVIVTAGNHADQTGTVLSFKGDRAIVQGVNFCTKHVKPSKLNQQGGIIKLERPINISNLRVCNADKEPLKLKVKTTDAGDKQLVSTIDGQEVLYRSVKNHK